MLHIRIKWIIIGIIILGCLLAILYWAYPKEPILTIYLSREKRTVRIPLERYVAGVVAAEMPSCFAMEALKAQAVIARTYALKNRNISKHNNVADLCDDPAHCQAYKSLDADVNLGVKVKAWTAALSTKGQVIVYRGHLAEAVYHSTCGGHTENASWVWQSEVPYLKGVPCHTDKHSPFYRQTIQLPKKSLMGLLKLDPAKPLNPKITERTPSGRAYEVSLGGNSYKAVYLRKVLNLPSTYFEVEEKEDALVFGVKGWGHGVGLCQYGADGLARSGFDYIQILQYYYPGIDVYKFRY